MKRIPDRIILNGSPIEARQLLRRAPEREASGESGIRELISRLNRGRDFGRETAEEWMRYLGLLVSGHAEALMNPYADLDRVKAEPISRNAKHLNDSPWIRQLKPLERTFSDDSAMDESTAESEGLLGKMILILAVGGADTTFYSGMSPRDIEEFIGNFIPSGLLDCLDASVLAQGVPRAFASKPMGDGRGVSVVESLMEQAFAAGITHVAVMTNSGTAPAVTKYLDRRFPGSSGLKWTVTVQPLLPVIVECPEPGEWTISEENGGMPGGHGHAFKHALLDDTVRGWIAEDGLECFLFSNGDNAALFNGGVGHFIETLETMRALKREGGSQRLRTAFYLVWEKFRKGGFAFCLTDKGTGDAIPQIIEAELALHSGARVDVLNDNRGGYNTNVAVGFLSEAVEHVRSLPLSLKKKRLRGRDHWMFEASFATAMSTTQDGNGRTHFDPGSSIVVLAPDEAAHPHWIHVSLRNRSEWLAYHSSIFSPRPVRTHGREFNVIQSDRDASIPLPRLEGGILGIGTGEFWDVFRKASIDLDAFTGVLRIDFPDQEPKPRGRICFEGDIRFTGDGKVIFRIPAGESWIVRDAVIQSPAEFTEAEQIPGDDPGAS